MGKVRFPTFAPWWDEAEAELLKFPSGKNDDFVDALAWLGLGLSTMVAPSAIKTKREDMHPPGSMEWILRQTSMQMATAKRANTAGW